MTLASHGYIFVGKGTVPVFVRDLKHEGRIYQKLERVQGVSVPVYLGNIDLIHRYFYDVGVRIVHMLLMSWAGEVAEDGDTADLKGEVQRSVQDICNERVIHSDVRQPNILWNLERRRAMLVDFERAEVLDDRKRLVGPSLLGRASTSASPSSMKSSLLAFQISVPPLAIAEGRNDFIAHHHV